MKTIQNSIWINKNYEYNKTLYQIHQLKNYQKHPKTNNLPISVASGNAVPKSVVIAMRSIGVQYHKTETTRTMIK